MRIFLQYTLKLIKTNQFFLHFITRVVSLCHPQWIWKLIEKNVSAPFFFFFFVKVQFFESNAHSIFYGTSAIFAETECRARFFFLVGVIRGAASVSSSVKRDARCSEASCTLAALCGNDHREDRLYSFSPTVVSVTVNISDTIRILCILYISKSYYISYFCVRLFFFLYV